jgi:hypothetical protein
VWRKVRADILQRVDASADFVFRRGGNVGAEGGFLQQFFPLIPAKAGIGIG